jgi:hypothetical protein
LGTVFIVPGEFPGNNCLLPVLEQHLDSDISKEPDEIMANTRVGIYVDSMNIMRSGGYGMRYEIIRRFAARDGEEVMRLNAYVAMDEDRAGSDPNYKNTLNFILTLRDLGFKVVEKATSSTRQPLFWTMVTTLQKSPSPVNR